MKLAHRLSVGVMVSGLMSGSTSQMPLISPFNSVSIPLACRHPIANGWLIQRLK